MYGDEVKCIQQNCIFEYFAVIICVFICNVYMCFTSCIYCQKSLEEEKREHVKKAGDILNWVSKVTKMLSKEGGEGESAEMTPISKPQVLETLFGYQNS